MSAYLDREQYMLMKWAGALHKSRKYGKDMKKIERIVIKKPKPEQKGKEK